MMCKFCDLFSRIVSNFSENVGVQDWLALIALIITVIGLTSLAEKRTVIGVDYGKYLIDEYKILGWVRVFHVFIGIAVINALALVVMLHNFPAVVEFVVFALLILCAWFVLVYLFSYVLRIHPRVKREIYKRQILGLYVNSDTDCDFEGDRVVGMHGGDRTVKKLSSNVQSYFNQYDEQTIAAFAELFGPDSLVYSRSRRILAYWRKLGYGEPHDYSVYERGKKMPVHHISWEFFQMYRFSDIQDRWLLEILNLFNGSYADAHPRLRLYNVARVIGHINRVGHADGLWRYKFLDYLMPYVLRALDATSDSDVDGRERVEEYLHRQLALYMQNVCNRHPNPMFLESVEKAFRLLLNIEFFRGVVPIKSRIKIYRSGATGEYKTVVERAARAYNKQRTEIQNLVLDFGNVLVDWKLENLFGPRDRKRCRDRKLFEEVLDPAWIRVVDSSESLREVVEQRKVQYPGFAKELDLFYSDWGKTVKGEIPGMLELVRELKTRYAVYGLSNWCREAFERVRGEHGTLMEIDNYVISGGLVDGAGEPVPPKPDAKIIQYFLDKFQLDKSTCLFVDDRLENVQAARHFGMRAILFRDARQLRLALAE